jgi:hypothetical protein
MANEKRLIDANVVLAKQFTAGLSDARGNYYGHADVVFVDDIENAPTVDAVEVVHGRWILKETCGKHTEKFHCSVCDKVPKSLCVEAYCPNCGAKMDGDIT